MDHVYNFKHIFNFKKNTKKYHIKGTASILHSSKLQIYLQPRQDTLVKSGFGMLRVNRFKLSGLFLLSQKVSLGLIAHNIIVHNASKLGIYATVKG